MKINKAVILAAGFGTRMLPASKVIPKELLPVVDTPAIQLIVEEIAASGIDRHRDRDQPRQGRRCSIISARARTGAVSRTARQERPARSRAPARALARITTAEQDAPLGSATRCCRPAIRGRRRAVRGHPARRYHRRAAALPGTIDGRRADRRRAGGGAATGAAQRGFQVRNCRSAALGPRLASADRDGREAAASRKLPATWRSSGATC